MFQRLTDNDGSSDYPQISVGGTNLHVVWDDATFSAHEIFYKRSSDNGDSWSFQRLTDNSGYSTNPRVIAGGGIAHVVWEDSVYSGNFEILYKQGN